MKAPGRVSLPSPRTLAVSVVKGVRATPHHKAGVQLRKSARVRKLKLRKR